MTLDDVKKIDLRVSLLTDEAVAATLNYPNNMRLVSPTLGVGFFLPNVNTLHPFTDLKHRVRLYPGPSCSGFNWQEYFHVRSFITNVQYDSVDKPSHGLGTCGLTLFQDLRNSLKLVLWAKLLTPSMILKEMPMFQRLDLRA